MIQYIQLCLTQNERVTHQFLTPALQYITNNGAIYLFFIASD